ncbi:DUF6941 family protein [Nesterenkonia sphaerica]|uniref:Uncharacterized protein n=1 Tax=Nesterenkonia sphaerica TaxID=1804988 RepID=A0A5R9A4G9_9MICC|nr:hypothetical protein [Nesterenkonia sphaerica]TLP72945.1 hypothetical protein FEF27_10980 [Nesterenkonia sphaerica]
MSETQLEEPELDYAYLAEYARTERGAITAVGASYTRVLTDLLPMSFTVYVAGRFRAPAKGQPFEVDITFGRADDDETIRLGNTFNPATAPDSYRDRVGLTFAVGIPAEVENEGLHKVEIFANNRSVRKLFFDVDLDRQGAASGDR